MCLQPSASVRLRLSRAVGVSERVCGSDTRSAADAHCSGVCRADRARRDAVQMCRRRDAMHGLSVVCRLRVAGAGANASIGLSVLVRVHQRCEHLSQTHHRKRASWHVNAAICRSGMGTSGVWLVVPPHCAAGHAYERASSLMVGGMSGVWLRLPCGKRRTIAGHVTNRPANGGEASQPTALARRGHIRGPRAVRGEARRSCSAI